MLIALYQSHHQLPFWGGETNPFDIFKPEKYKDLPFEGPTIVENNTIIGNETITLEKEKYFFSFLSGLHNIKANNLMAHVSGLCRCKFKKEGYWHYEKRIWVQITTLSKSFTEDSIPIVYDMLGKLNQEVISVWGGDNGTYSPYGFFNEKLQEKAANDPKIWERFFVEQLDLDETLRVAKDNFRAAEEILKEAKDVVEGLQVFGPDELNLKINQRFNVC